MKALSALMLASEPVFKIKFEIISSLFMLKLDPLMNSKKTSSMSPSIIKFKRVFFNSKEFSGKRAI